MFSRVESEWCWVRCCPVQGPMWRQIRGQGLSYNYNLFVRPCDGLLYFCLTKSSLVAAAYGEALQIVVSAVALGADAAEHPGKNGIRSDASAAALSSFAF